MIFLFAVMFIMAETATPSAENADSARIPESGASSVPAVSAADSILKPAPAITAGTLRINSKPDSVIVVIDSVMRGTTPIVLESFAAGEHTVLLKKDGYYMKKAVFSMPADSALSLEFELVKPLDRVFVSSPAGAKISVDDKPAGVTPASAGKLKPGMHSVVISLDGYNTVTDSVMVSPNGPDTLKFNLTAVKPANTSNPSSAPKNDSRRQKVANRIAIGIFLALTLTIVMVELADMNN
jgi:hypothetical protein